MIEKSHRCDLNVDTPSSNDDDSSEEGKSLPAPANKSGRSSKSAKSATSKQRLQKEEEGAEPAIILTVGTRRFRLKDEYAAKHAADPEKWLKSLVAGQALNITGFEPL